MGFHMRLDSLPFQLEPRHSMTGFLHGFSWLEVLLTIKSRSFHVAPTITVGGPEHNHVRRNTLIIPEHHDVTDNDVPPDSVDGLVVPDDLARALVELPI